jgi:hypothetical protein
MSRTKEGLNILVYVKLKASGCFFFFFTFVFKKM